MPIDDYLGKLEGVISDSKIIRPASNILNPESFIILEGRPHGLYSYPDLLVSMERSHLGRNWVETHKALRGEDSFMLNLRQYLDFLKLLNSDKVYDGNGDRLDYDKRIELLVPIFKGGLIPMGEYLDAFFNVNPTNESLIINYDHRISAESLHPLCSQVLGKSTDNNKIMGVNIDEWLNEFSQNLRINSKIFIENAKYLAPKGIHSTVAGFVGAPDEVCLDCNYDPKGHYLVYGVRQVKIKE